MIHHGQVTLRRTVIPDLEFLFEFQLDKEANHLAAFTPKDPTNKAAYLEKFAKHLEDPTINMQTILVDGIIVGSIAKFEMRGDTEITYWIDKNFGDKGLQQQHLITSLHWKAQGLFLDG
ncbi:GNAT family N-acetyltransferase [Chitinophaga sp. MD30]|uniref:GNAT family N-acetyltransferase n=1 Tax=Chitinophaga sp. MD30 TaxID=2033437 RepID=UPI001E388A24|nr:hypothetical protein [Chitinophaga sp. MD30]